MSFLSNITGSYKSQIQDQLSSLGISLPSALRARLSSWGLSFPIGSLGDITFEVSSSKVRTFDKYERKTSARFTEHELVGVKPILEFVGPGTEEISFVMRFTIQLGVNPREEADRIRALCDKGEAMHFILSNTVVGANQWVITEAGESVETIDNSGRIIVSELQVTLKEYVPQMAQGA